MATPDPWRALPAGRTPDLLPSHVHVWRFRLDGPASALPEFAARLDPSEQERAVAFVFAADRARFIVGRGMLRGLIGGYAGIEPHAIVFDRGPEGKPWWRDRDTTRPLQFNLSHSGDLALLAVTRAGAVGADIEQLRELAEAEQIARHHFATAEVDHWLALPASEREAAFFACWTRKEAYVKAMGGGLGIALDRFEVSFADGAAAQLRSIEGSTAAAREWTMCDIQVGPGVAAAVAVHATGVTLQRFEIA